MEEENKKKKEEIFFKYSVSFISTFPFYFYNIHFTTFIIHYFIDNRFMLGIEFRNNVKDIESVTRKNRIKN